MFWSVLISFLHEEDGPTAMEYALIVALIAVAIVGSVMLFGGSSDGAWNKNVETLHNDVWSQAS